MCKQLQRFRLNNTIIIQTQHTLKRVANALFKIDRLQIKQFQYYINNQAYIKQIEETIQIKLTKKFEDSLQAKIDPVFTQCLEYYFIVLADQMKLILKQISEQIQDIISKFQILLPNNRNQIKNELNQMILIWLILHFITQQEELKDQYPHLFFMVWKKYQDLLQQSILFQIISKDMNLPTTIQLTFIQQLRIAYYDQLIMFSEQIMIFSSSFLLSLNLNELLEQLMSSMNVLRPLNQIQFILILKEQMINLAIELMYMHRQSYVEKALITLISFIDFLILELEQIKYGGQQFKFMIQKLLHQYNSFFESFQ